MTIQPTEQPEPPEGAALLACAAAVYQFLAEHPRFAQADSPLGISLERDGTVSACPLYLHPDSFECVMALADALHATVERTSLLRDKSTSQRLVGLYVTAVYCGVPWRVRGYVPAEPYEAFAADHDPDPQAWPTAERAEFAAFARVYAAAVAE